MGHKYEDIRWKWLEERGIYVMGDEHQLEYMKALWTPCNVIQGVFCESPAGTGKTELAVLAGAYSVEKTEYKKIIYLRSNDTVGKELGFLPGDLKGKTDPFMTPFIEALDKVEKGLFEKWCEEEKAIATVPAYLRGVTFDDAFVILDEAQSYSLEELQAIKTRPKKNCKMVTIGSLRQIDRKGLKLIAGLTPFEVYMEHFKGKQVSYHKLVKNYRGWYSLHADNIQDTVKRLREEEKQNQGA